MNRLLSASLSSKFDGLLYKRPIYLQDKLAFLYGRRSKQQSDLLINQSVAVTMIIYFLL